MVSVILTVGISLSIPQVISGMEEYLTGQAKEMNQGDLKIITAFSSQPFDTRVEELQADGYEVSVSEVYSISVKYHSNKLFCQLLVGDYELGAEEILLSKEIAAKLGLGVGDSLTIMDQSYLITGVEQGAYGVDATSEMFGYVKVSEFDSYNLLATTRIFYLKGTDIDRVKEELSELVPQYTYTTVADQEENTRQKLNMNLLALSTLNTMSILMSILSTISTIVMIIIERQKDIAIMKLISIGNRSIMKAFRAELKLMLLVPLAIGSCLSIPLAQYLLQLKQVKIERYHFEYAILGFVLYAFIYFIFVNIATGVIGAIKPLSVLKNEKVSWKKAVIRIVFSSFLFTLISLIGYSIFIGKGSAMVSSFAIIIFILIFFLITLLIIRLAVTFKPRNQMLRYTVKSLRSNSFSFALTVLSIALTIWFVLFGFSMETTCKESYNSSVQDKISYNYMMVSDDVAGSELELNSYKDVEGYTKLSREIGTYYNEVDSSGRAIILCGIDKEFYTQQFALLEGEDVFEGSEQEILISDKFSGQVEKSVGDTLELLVNNRKESYRIKGIYESGGVNDNFILKARGREASWQNVLFLIKADTEDFLTDIKDASFVDINVMGEAILKMLNDFLLVFKYLCGICIVAAILFNSNMIYMNHCNSERESAIIRALGLGKGFLYQSAMLRFGTSLVLSLIIALGLYGIILKTALSVTLGAELTLSIYALRLPILFVLIIAAAYCLLSFYLIRRTEGYEVLREQV
jgi:putative ABC transport system permease protein